MYITPYSVYVIGANTDRNDLFSAIVRSTPTKTAINCRKTGRRRINRSSREEDRTTSWKSAVGVALRRTCRIGRSRSSRSANSTTSPAEQRSGPRHKVNIGYLCTSYNVIYNILMICYME